MISTRELFNLVQVTMVDSNVCRGGVHIGAVPRSLPTYQDGTVHEYGVIWPRIPVPVDDEPVAEHQLLDGYRLPFQTTLVSDDLLLLMDMVDAIAPPLTELKVNGYQVKRRIELEPESFLFDESLNPTRWWAPLVWEVNVQ